MHPRLSGQGFVPRYGGGWMHQFGHVYALQQELLAPDRSNWFRAVELWHTARHEGLALNAVHYTNILRQCVPAAAWEQSLLVLRQMRRDAIRPDVVGVACAMAACADAAQPQATVAIFKRFAPIMKLDSQCYLALMKVHNRARDYDAAIEAAVQQVREDIPILPASLTEVVEAACGSDGASGCDVAVEAVERMEADMYLVPAVQKKRLAALAMRHGMTAHVRRLERSIDGDDALAELRFPREGVAHAEGILSR